MSAWYWAGYTLSKLIGRIFFRYRVIHPERMIQTGPVILAMNHQSYLDPPLAGIACKRPIYFLARKSLLNVPILGRILPKLNVIPVDQEGMDRGALKALLRILRAGEGALVFPEGARTPNGNLQPALPGLGFIIAKTRAPVVPMRIFGSHEALPRGGGRLRFHPITVVIGRPMYFTELDISTDKKDLYQQLSRRVMNEIASLTING
ncbi:MAG: 1-acyl-sn-glycerol-3-phosphate acyltransferase [Verrucomicrobia bacterium]|nr:MAG: 1-acyl-sn-glycerol-3-phosphate acyltransferase [Verrucomicrobiota bacterium]